MSNTKEQAFPFMERVWCTDTDQYILGNSTSGMHLRDYFAAKALSNSYTASSSPHHIAQYAYDVADAMLEARKVTP